MNFHRLRLHPSVATAISGRSSEVLAGAERKRNQIWVEFRVSLGTAGLALPTRANAEPSRQNRLWENTCYEFFFRDRRSPTAYFEVNLNSVGDWNVYAFDGYRIGMREEARLDQVAITLAQTSPESLQIQFTFDLEKLGLENADLEYALTCVLKNSEGEIDYWAMEHAGEQPDFHRPESFTGELPGG